MEHEVKAAEYFMQGYNCAQSVAMAFSDVVGLSPLYLARMASPFGGGLGRLRETCGAVSGMLMIYGILYGYDTSNDDVRKGQVYGDVQALVEEFRTQIGSILCRELLGNPSSSPVPTPRTAEFYKERPCGRFVQLGAKILDAYIETHPQKNPVDTK